jgi:putative transposase
MNNPPDHHRRSIRLPEYDYASPGAYFVTLVTHTRLCLFGEIKDGEMEYSALGLIAGEEWIKSVGIRKEIQLFEDEFVVMPNHLHAIVWLVDVGADGVCPDGIHPNIQGAHRAPQQQQQQVPQRAPRSLGSFIAGYKASVTSRARKELDMTGIWQRNYYDHIIRSQEEHRRIYAYIETNPIHWNEDEENPSASN